MKLNSQQLHVLQHSLGVDQYGRGRQYRNHFVTGEQSDNWALCQSLVALGLMQDHGAQTMMGGMHCFTVTDPGKAAMASESPRPPAVSVGRGRYLKYLEEDSTVSFGEWLRRGFYKEVEA